jgi:hypothetical protein
MALPAAGGLALSISQINKIFQNKGCNIAVSAVLGLTVISMLGVGTRGCSGNPAETSSRDGGMPIVTAGEYEITKELVSRLAQQQMQQFGGADLPASFKTRMEGSALAGQINSGLALILAKKQGIDFSDAILRKRIIESQMEATRGQLEQSGQLRPGASEQELEDAYKKITGRSFLEARKEFETDVDTKLADPQQRVGIDASMAAMLLIDNAKSKFMPTEAAVKAQFDTFHLKQVQVSGTDAGKEGAEAKAKRIRNEIKGGLSFEAAMEKYNSTPAAKGKKKSDEVQQKRRDLLESNPDLKSLLTLKPGEVSEVIPSMGTYQMFKLVKITHDVPKDFDKQKVQLMDTKARTDAAKSITEEIKKLDTPENVKWKNEGYRLLHDYLVMENGPAAKPSERPKKVKEIIEAALKLKDDPLSGDIASSVAMTAFSEIKSTLTPAELTSLQIPVLDAYAQHFPEVDVKIELAQAYVKAGDKDNTGRALLSAADANSIHFEPTAKTHWGTINREVAIAREKKLVEIEDATKLNKIYTDWLKEYADQLKVQKQLEAEQKKRDEELKKAGEIETPKTPPEKKKPVDEGSSNKSKNEGDKKKPAGQR